MTTFVQEPDTEEYDTELDPLRSGRAWPSDDNDELANDGATAFPSGPLGIDVSVYQPKVDWAKVAEAGRRFAYVRLSYSRSVDKWAARHWSGARDAGLLCGGYHFFRNTTEVARQVDAFLGAVASAGGYSADALPPALDLEWDRYGSFPSSARAREKYMMDALAWLEQVRAEVKKPPLVYTGPNFWRDIRDPDGLKQFGLWVARPERRSPRLPKPWSQYLFWQYSHKGTLPGLAGAVDLNVFRGTEEELRELCSRQA